jgi:hypothetical protein
LRSGYDREAFLFREFGGFYDVFDAGRIDGYGFFDENVFTCLDCGLEVDRAEDGWSGQDDEIYIASDDVLVGIKAREHRLGGDLVDVTEREVVLRHVFANRLGSLLKVIREEVAHGDELDVGVGLGAVDDAGSATAAAESDKADTNFVVRSSSVEILGSD